MKEGGVMKNLSLRSRFMYYSGILIASLGSEVIEDLNHISNLLDAEHEGRILKTPCKVGDEFWVIAYRDKKITHVKCTGYSINHDTVNKKCNHSIAWIDSIENPRDYWKLTFDEFNRQCFATKAAAEKALEEMEK